MTELGEKIWQRRNARQIMREARKKFKEQEGSGYAHVALASVHYSLIKRYTGRIWSLPLALWHTRRAVVHAKAAGNPSEFDAVDVITTILSKAPWWLGGNISLAYKLVNSALDYVPVAEPSDAMQPHTRALLLITRGQLEQRFGMKRRAWQTFFDALDLESHILKERDHLMAKRQLVRVLSAAGLGLWDTQNSHTYPGHLYTIARALKLADEVSEDQALKIRAEARKRGILHMIEYKAE